MTDSPRGIPRRTFVRALTAAVAIGSGACARREEQGAAPRRPNIVLVMCDDLGYADVGFNGATAYRTPGIDRIASEGMILRQSYSAAPVCSPTRVALMTGRYPARASIGLLEPLTTHPQGLSPTPATLPLLLKRAGYHTALVGKWHLGVLPEFHPFRHGFDEFYGFLGAAVDYASKRDTEYRAWHFHDGETPVRPEGYLTDVLTSRAERVISAPRGDRPFFLSLQYNAPHWPWQGPDDPAYPDTLDSKAGGTPDKFAAMMKSLDDGVARVLAALDARDLTRDTLVIFTSDNGGERFSHMGPLSHGKMTLSEGGIRVATAVRWPAFIEAGSVSEQPCITMDLTATMLAIAGATSEQPLDGIDLRGAFSGAAPRPRELCWRITQRREQRAIRRGDLKLVVDSDGSRRLFDLSTDVAEKQDLAAQRPSDMTALFEAYGRWERQMLPPVPLEARYR